MDSERRIMAAQNLQTDIVVNHVLYRQGILKTFYNTKDQGETRMSAGSSQTVSQ